jgi:hypothetical protein
MKRKSSPHSPLRKPIFTLFILFLPIFISALTCSFPIADQSQKETSIAQDVQATLNAEKVMTLEAQQTSLANVEPIASQPSEATLEAQDTSVVTNQTPTSETLETVTGQPPLSPTGVLTPLTITEWKMQSFAPLSSGCKTPDKPCWKSVPIADLDEMLISKNSIYIDPNWQNPCLSFWHQSVKRGYDTMFSAEILAGVDGKYVMIKKLNTFIEVWKRDFADLEMFKGKDIYIHFVRYPGATSWFIQDVEILAECPLP